MPTRNITLDHFGTTLEPLWNHFGTTLEPLWDHFGTTLEPRNITLESLDNLSNEACRLLCSHLEEWVSKVRTSWKLGAVASGTGLWVICQMSLAGFCALT